MASSLVHVYKPDGHYGSSEVGYRSGCPGRAAPFCLTMPVLSVFSKADHTLFNLV
jgi:hypothetical protein